MAKRLLLLEILDPSINAFFNEIACKVCPEKAPDPTVHITIRGPYSGSISKSKFERVENALRYDVLKIEGIGRFSNRCEEVVYFGVDSPRLREVWHKPDYPIKECGFNPHISVYRGKDKILADRLYAFLSEENISLLCAEHQLIVYTLSEKKLKLDYSSGRGSWTNLVKRGKLAPDFIERLDRALAWNSDGSSSGCEPSLQLCLE